MIQPNTPLHEETILNIWYSASLSAQSFLGVTTLEAQRELVKKDYLPKSFTWVYQHNEKVTGFISMLGNHIGALFIYPDFQNQGYGKALIDHVKTLFPEVTVGVYLQNKKAQLFYQRNGFCQSGIERQPETNEFVVTMVYKR